MAGNTTDLSSPESRHEHSDVDVRAIVIFAIALALLAIAALAALFGAYRYLVNREGGPVLDSQTHPPAPQLEETPALDWQRQLAAEEQILHSYGWVNPGEGIVRIPIERAIDILAQRGLPARPAEDRNQ